MLIPSSLRNAQRPSDVAPRCAVALACMLCVCFSATAAQAAAPSSTRPDMKLTITGRKQHPIVYLTRADLARARANRDAHPWARAAAERLLRDADAWVAKGDDDLRKLIPPPGACFAYGFTGCPQCGAKTGSSWGQGGACTLADPGHIKCDNGHRLPNERFPDDGTGYKDPKTGKIHYLVGSYNAFVIDTLNDALTKLCLAYGLSNDVKYGQKAALILDELARIYPTCTKGSWDYPSDPPSGRFNRPWYQVARTLILYANHYDLLMNDESGMNVLDAPSSVEGLTRRQNIERNLLLNGAGYCFQQSKKMAALNNGEADYIRGAMVVGAAMGIPQYIEWGVNGPYGIVNMVENNIDRDGQYYETSSLYSHHSRYLYMDIAELLNNYRDDGAFRDGIHLADNPKFQALFMLPNSRLEVAGVKPMLGDDGPNPKHVDDDPGNTPDGDDLMNLEHLLALRPDDPSLPRLLLTAAGGSEGLAKARQASKAGDWLLFHAQDVRDVEAAPEVRHPLTALSLADSDLLAQRGLAILRATTPAGDVAATLRAGPTLNHGHYDEMGLCLYANGNDLTYDLGYGLGSTHTQVGWAKQTASHNVVLVDEASQLSSGRAGGTIERFLALPGLSLVSADDPAAYAGQGVDRYQRTIMLIGGNGEPAYLLDIFRVRGGKQHDYLFHARGTAMTIEGVDLGENQTGSLAGRDVDWGAHLGNDGDVTSVPNKPYWNPPPGNGFGFIVAPRSGKAERAWSATWVVDQSPEHPARLRLTMLPIASGIDVVTADVPGIYPYLPKAGYVMARRKPSDGGSTFAALLEPYASDGERPMREVELLSPPAADADAPVAVKVTLQDGRSDLLISGAMPSVKAGDLAVISDAALARLRLDANQQPEALFAIEGKRLSAGDVTLRLDAERYEGGIDRIDFEQNILYTAADLPAGSALAGQFVNLGNDATGHRSSYRIDHVSSENGKSAIHLSPTTLILGRIHLDRDPPDGKTLPNIVPLEYAKSLAHKDSGFFTGKTIATADGRARTTITGFDGAKGTTISVSDASGFRSGDDAVIYDAQPGDHFTIPCWAQVTRSGAGGTWQCRSNVPVTIEAAGKSQRSGPPQNGR